MANFSQPETEDKFLIGNMADDLVDLTLTICDKRESYAEKEERRIAKAEGWEVPKKKPSKFPSFLYDTYVKRMICIAMDIQESVILANEYQQNNTQGRKDGARFAMAKCVELNHLIRISANKRWISEKERDRWQGLTTNLRWKIFNWVKSMKG